MTRKAQRHSQIRDLHLNDPSFLPSQPDASDFLKRIPPERIALFCAEVVHTNIQRLQRDNPGKEIVIVYANGSKFYRVNGTPRLGAQS